MSTPDSSGVLEVRAANENVPDDDVDTTDADAADCLEATAPETKKMSRSCFENREAGVI